MGSFFIAAFTFFNINFAVIPSYQRFMKFLHRNAEYQSLPANASEMKKQQSIAKLELAPSNLMIENTLTDGDRVDMIIDLFGGGEGAGQEALDACTSYEIVLEVCKDDEVQEQACYIKGGLKDGRCFGMFHYYDERC